MRNAHFQDFFEKYDIFFSVSLQIVALWLADQRDELIAKYIYFGWIKTNVCAIL
jgi:hypothetical protein